MQALSSSVSGVTSDRPVALGGIHLVTFYNALIGHSAPVNDVKVANNGLLLSGSDDRTIKVWDLDDAKKQDCLYSLNSEAGRVLSLATLAHNAFASGHLDSEGTVMTWNMDSRTGSLLGKHNFGVSSLAFNQEKNLLFSATRNGQDHIKEWNLTTREGTTFNKSSYARSLEVVSPDALLSSWGNIAKWDLEGNLTVFGHSPAEAWALGLSPDRTLLVSGSEDHSKIKIWNARTGDVLHTASGPNSHKAEITAFAFLTKDILVSASLDCSLRFWNLNTGDWLDTIENAHSGGITCLATRGNILISSSAGDNYEIKLWKKTS